MDTQEGIPVDKVEARPRRTSEVTDNEVDFTRATGNSSIEATRPDLPIGRQLVGVASDIEPQRLQLVIFGGGDGKEAGGVVQGSPRQFLIFIVCVCRRQVSVR